jgi:hypothetical protein
MAAMTRVAVAPPIAHLAFSILVPADFHQVPIPAEEKDFADPSAMMPCGVFMAGYGAVLCTVAARPAFDDGSVMDWAMYLVGQQEGFAVKKLMPERRWGTQVVEVEATQPSEAGEMTVHAIFFEDGGRLFNIGRMAPTAIWPSVKDTLAAMVDSFALAQVDGPTRPVAAGTPLPPKAQFALPPAGGEPAGQPTAAAGQASAPALTPAAHEPSAAAGVPPASAAQASVATSGTDGLPDMSAYAFDDAAALDPEDEINARFRDAGAGLTVNVLARDEAKKCAAVGAGALAAIMPVPFGWHVVDDGRRTLIFDRGNRVQINLTLFPIDGQGPSEIFTAILQGFGDTSPAMEHREFEAAGMNVMQVRNVVIDGETLCQAYFLKRHPHADNLALKVRVTASEADIPTAIDLTAAVVEHLRWGGGD